MKKSSPHHCRYPSKFCKLGNNLAAAVAVHNAGRARPLVATDTYRGRYVSESITP